MHGMSQAAKNLAGMREKLADHRELMEHKADLVAEREQTAKKVAAFVKGAKQEDLPDALEVMLELLLAQGKALDQIDGRLDQLIEMHMDQMIAFAEGSQQASG